MYDVSDNPLGYKKILPLLFSLAWPAIIANLVNSLYNIVDQIFIGQGIGYLGNAATNIAFPITTICLSIGLLFGVGGAANFSLELGKNNPQKASKVAANSLVILVVIGVVLGAFILLFLEPLMLFFGATSQILQYSKDYSGIIALGVPFALVSIGINAIVRADGSPKFSMFSIIIGAVINIVLDPIFIFSFNMGMKGAALATIIGQIVSALVLFYYYFHFKSVRFKTSDFYLNIKVLGRIAALGASSFIFQAATFVVQITTNVLLNIYGAASVYGSDIPIAVAGIVAKVNTIFISIIIGLVQGSQPICSFNYGAKNYGRVLDTIKLVSKLALGFSILCWGIFELFPGQIISIFGSGSEEYFHFAIRYTRIFSFFLFLNGIQISATTFFSAIGKAKTGAVLSFTKQIIFLLPLLFVMSYFWGVDGIIYATPIADFLSFSVVICFLVLEMRELHHKELANNA